MSIRICIYLLLVTFPVAADARAAQSVLYVSVDGDDAANGSQATPLASIGGAQSRIRELRAVSTAPLETVRVIIQGGTYEIAEPIRMTAKDGGSEGAPVIYEAAPNEIVTIRGGASLGPWKSSSLGEDTQATSRPRKLWYANLPTEIQSESLRRSARSARLPSSPAEGCVVAEGKSLRRAGWPNDGWAFAHDLMAANSWRTNELLLPAGIEQSAWAHGFWENESEDALVPVGIRGTADGTLIWLTTPSQSFSRGARYRIENVLMHLDSQDEWYLDHERKLIYVADPDIAEKDCFITLIESPLSLYGCSHLELRNIIVEGARNCGIEIVGGNQLILDTCTVRNVGNVGIHVYHGRGHQIVNCQVRDTGCEGIRVEAGDRMTLEPAEHLLTNNQVSDFGVRQMTYRAGISVLGVGTEVRGNTVSNGPYSAITICGNEHRVIGNHIHDVCTEANDCGAIYCGGDPTYRGNLIDGNVIHDIGGSGRKDIMGIYLDDFVAENTVSNNTVQRVARGIAVGGGRENLIVGNVVVDCLACIQLDARGTTWASDFVSGPNAPYFQFCKNINASGKVYGERYPALLSSFADTPGAPKGNIISGNLVDGGIAIDLQDDASKQYVVATGNVTEALRFLVDRGDGIWELRTGMAADQPPTLLQHYISTQSGSPSDRE